MIKLAKSIIIIYVLMFLVIFALKFFGKIDELAVTSSIYAGVLNLINSAVFIGAFQYAREKSNQVFLIATLGVMTVRLLLMLAAIFLAINFLNIDKYAFILVFFVFYFLSLMTEVFFLKGKRTLIKKTD